MPRHRSLNLKKFIDSIPEPLIEEYFEQTKILGDINAIQKGKVGLRLPRRGAGKLTGRGLAKLFK